MSGSASRAALAPAADHGQRSVLAYLLHALNQPLTGLQCSLELATVAARTPAQYVRTLQEGLDLTQRMRLLVETIREITDPPTAAGDEAGPFRLDSLVSETAAGLAPVAEIKGVRLKSECLCPLLVGQSRTRLSGLTFRLLESAIALAQPGTDVKVTTSFEGQQALLVVSWRDGSDGSDGSAGNDESDRPAHEGSPFSRADLGLLIARAGWEQAGAKWGQESAGGWHSCSVRIGAACPQPPR
jgi:hypothetical protein